MSQTNQPDHEFIGKCLFFPKQGILVVGDLHIGYELEIVESGILIPERQVEEVIENLEHSIEKIKAMNQKIKKVIFLGDVKHMFSYDYREKKNFSKVLDFLTRYVKKENIIIIKGNHDTSELGLKLHAYYIDDGIAFLHGHISFPEVFAKEVHTVVSGHLHPSIVLSEKPGVKKESYKCFLKGKSRGKTFIVVPSFLGFYEGTPINEYREEFMPSFSIIPEEDIMKFRVYVVGEDKVYEFGKVGDLE